MTPFKSAISTCCAICLLSVAVAATAAGPANNAKFEYVPTAKERLIREEGLGILVQAIHAAGMVDLLRNDGPYTLLAPNNDAFGKLDSDTLEDLLKLENQERLASLLSRHILEGEFSSKEISELNSLQMINGEALAVSVDGKRITIENADVLKPDITASNGVVHVIDALLIEQ